MRPLGPTMRRRQLGAELRALRHNADIAMERVAAILDCARFRIGHIENGRNSIRYEESTFSGRVMDEPRQGFPLAGHQRIGQPP
ncbi:MAG: helix-turn-helix domain-containing protein [Pseudonocardiales bacterium]|nr:helix-turn-helix domain-containing protein [Pseudonocardiales bacterium]